MTDATDDREAGPTRRRRARRAPLLLAVATVVAVAAGALVLREPGAPVQQVTVAGAADDPASRVDGGGADGGGVESASEVVRRAIDPTVPLAERAVLFEQRSTDDPTVEQVLESFDGLGERAGAQLSDVAVSARTVGTGTVVVDVRVEMDGTFGTRSTLRSLVVQLTDGEWLLTRESLCGLAAGAAVVGAATQCGSAATVRYGSGRANPSVMLAPEAGEAVDLSNGIGLGYWSDDTAQIGGSVWFVDYPQIAAGGGPGPVGPADLVQLDVTSGAETARVRVAGAVTAMSADDGVLWALHTVHDPAAGPIRTTLTRVDAGSARITGELPMGSEAYDLLAAGDAVWVYGAGRLHRYAGAAPTPTGSVDTGVLIEPGAAAAVGAELWVRRSSSQVLAIDRQDLSTRTVDVPPGRLVGSDDQVWAVDAGPDGATARLLDRDGAVLRAVEVDEARDASCWGDGTGGLWVTGSALTSPSRSGAELGVIIDVVSRPSAVHVSSNGSVSGTWWAEDVRDQGTWFTPAGHGLGLFDPAGLTLLRS